MTTNEKENMGVMALSMRDIAAWQFPELNLVEKPVRVGIPSLQRGAVWNAGQVELFWDSMFRGFPVGALVVSPVKLASSQKTHSGQVSDKSGVGNGDSDSQAGSPSFTHHLLDGQQRCNAIALGFLDPLEPRNKNSPATLWLDLQEPPSSNESTRQFWFRVLTKAHPWGYKCDDKATRMHRYQWRDAMDEWDKAGQKRPKPAEIWPSTRIHSVSSAPLPLQWLMYALVVEGMRGDALWAHLAQKCSTIGRPWAQKTLEFIRDSSLELAVIERAALRAVATCIVALEWSGPTMQTNEEDSQEHSLLDVEQLFQRLNTQGTPLQGAELLYSMVKAYWPGMEAVIDQFGEGKPVDDARLAMLGFRAARIGLESSQNRYPGESSISLIRGWASLRGDKKQAEEIEVIRYYLGMDSTPTPSDFHKNVALIDVWLLWKTKGDFGVPKVLRSEIARDAPDVYVLLLDLAQRMRTQSNVMDEAQMLEWRRTLIGLVTSLFWFSEKRELAVQQIGTHLANSTLDATALKGVLSLVVDAEQISRMQVILTPKELEDSVQSAPADKDALQTWDIYKLMVGNTDDQERPHRDRIWAFFWRLANERANSFLLFAQRDLMGSEFSDYDPALKDTWAEHDRPWDVDHILSQDTLYRAEKSSLRKACDQWMNTLGNKRNCALETNRSKGAELTRDSISIDELAFSLITDAQAREAFTIDKSNGDLNNPHKVAAFANVARARLLNMYEDWYDTLQIKNLFHAPVGIDTFTNIPSDT